MSARDARKPSFTVAPRPRFVSWKMARTRSGCSAASCRMMSRVRSLLTSSTKMTSLDPRRDSSAFQISRKLASSVSASL
jgi:hypothetical protein